jgi:uncharacterized RDD family membrane protein YckC
MTQPPDDRMPPDEPREPTAGDEGAGTSGPPAEEAPAPDAPTVAWTAPEAASSDSAPPAEPMPPEHPAEPGATPRSPIISAEPTPPAAAPPASTGWQVPTPSQPLPPVAGGWQVATPPPTAAAVAGGWQTPPAQGQTGYVVGGAGARFVAWLIDGLLSSVVPGAIFILVFDWTSFFNDYFDQFQFDASGRLIPNANYTVTLPITLDVVLAVLILVGVQFLYFVGFWTSRWQATPGMIGLKMRVVDANTGAPLTVVQAVKRWFAMGWWLTVLFLAPVLQNAVGLAQFAVNVFIFLSTVIDDRRRGYHDKFAGSQVIRSVTSGSGATIVGCLLYIVLVFVVSLVAVALLIPAMGPVFQRLMEEYPRNSI